MILNSCWISCLLALHQLRLISLLYRHVQRFVGKATAIFLGVCKTCSNAFFGRYIHVPHRTGPAGGRRGLSVFSVVAACMSARRGWRSSIVEGHKCCENPGSASQLFTGNAATCGARMIHQPNSQQLAPQRQRIRSQHATSCCLYFDH